LIFFLGSGASKAYGSPIPNWNELLIGLLSEIRTENPHQREEISALIKSLRYLLAAEAIKRFGVFDTDKRDLAVDSLVAKILKQRENMSERNPILHLAILDFSVPIFTTNYDNIIESLIAEYKVDGYRRTDITYEDEEDASRLLSPTGVHENYVFKLHGSIDKTQRLILDEKDYSDFYFHARWPISLQLLRHTLATKMVVFIGFSLSDPDIMLILCEATRYSSSYQHIALLHKPAITSIEQEVLRSNYRVDPVLYDHHSHLPLYVMEMRNFYHREGIALQIKPDRESLIQALAEIKKENHLPSCCSTILFGSFAKYGKLSQPEADVDVLFLTDNSRVRSRLQSETANEKLGRKIDATAMARTELERLLRSGDPFASSILVTGCPLEDPDDRYGILCRGFRGNYKYGVVLQNAMDRYRMRWLRLCIYKDTELQDYFQACHQWSITLMQFFVIKNYYSLDSLLSISLLGNARYTIREFATRFNNVDEDYFISLMQAAKGLLPRQIERPSIREITQRFLDILQEKYSQSDLEVLLPGEFIQNVDLHRIAEVYRKLTSLLDALARGETAIMFGYGVTDTEKSFLEEIASARKNTGGRITTFDYLFFFRLHDLVKRESTGTDIKNERLFELCHLARDHWLKEVVNSYA
jgi:hypothetical protein